MSVRRLVVVFATAVLTSVLTSCDGETSRAGGGEDDGASAQCAAVVTYGGSSYFGYGDLKRLPETTGRAETGAFPPCNDGGGAAPLAEDVVVHELRDIPIEQALLVDDQLFLLEGAALPEGARLWFTAPGCEWDGSFELTGQWLGVTGGAERRFDGDIRPPYRLEVRVTAGPHRYVDTKLMIRATRETDPLLTPDDVKTSLWKGGGLTARVHCAGEQFIADALVSHPA